MSSSQALSSIDVRRLKRVLEALREAGVESFECDGMSVSFKQDPAAAIDPMLVSVPELSDDNAEKRTEQLLFGSSR